MKTPAFFQCRASLAGFFSAATILLLIASAAGFFGRFNWIFDLCSHFRLQYALAFIIAAAVFAARKKKRRALAFALLAALNFGVMLPHIKLGSFSRDAADGKPLRALLANINSTTGRPADVLELVRRCDPDIIVLEEMTQHWISSLQPFLELSHPYSKLCPSEDNFGIALWSKHPFDFAFAIMDPDASIPSILAAVKTPRGVVDVLATHPLPPAGAENTRLRDSQLARLSEWLRVRDSWHPAPALILGDLNTTPWNHAFKALLRDTGFSSASRGFGTWPAQFPTPFLRIPLDHALHSSGLRVAGFKLGPRIGSDHFPVILDFAIDGKQQGVDRAD